MSGEHDFFVTVPEVSEALLAGDMNNDDATDNLDITPFLVALTADGNVGAFAAEVSNGKFFRGDVDYNCLVNNTDITPFIGLLTAAGSNAPAVPEPSSLAWVVLALMMGRRRRPT